MNRVILSAAIVLALGVLAVFTPPTTRNTSAATTSVCFGQAWPSGYIRTNFYFSYNCGNYPQYPNTSFLESYYDKPGGSVMGVCNDNFIPTNWVLFETYWNSTQCGGSPASKNMAKIRAVAASDTSLSICANSPIPAGWHFVSQYQSSYGCGGLNAPYHLMWIIARN
ncbi:MAG TPA: hypothetical protein VGB17_16515 [Pyrinomonadaceae bacterium]|jgi:hypothetical protein